MSLREILNAMWLFGKMAQEPHNFAVDLSHRVRTF